MPAKVLFEYRFNSTGRAGYSIGEVQYYLGAVGAADDAAVNDAAVRLMNLRTQTMAANVLPIGYRVSIPGTRRRAYLVSAEDDPPNVSPLLKENPINQGFSEMPDRCINLLCYSITLERAIRKMCGIPDNVTVTGGAQTVTFTGPGLAGYQAAFTNYIEELLNSDWGFFTRQINAPANRTEILEWEQQTLTPFNLGIVLSDAATYKPAVRDIVDIQGVKMVNRNALRPFGKWFVDSITSKGDGTSVYELRSSSAYDASLVDWPGTVEPVVKAYMAYNKYELLGAGKRARGVGPVRPRGRSRPRQRLQPS